MALVGSSQPNVSTSDEWMRRWQEIEESLSKLRSKEQSTTDPVDLSSQVSDLRKETKDRTLLIKIHLQRYLVSWEELDRVFARFGTIEYIEVFCSGGDYHSKIRFQTRESAGKAVESFNHRNIFDGCCRMELFLDTTIDDMASKIEPTNQKTLEEIERDDQGMQMLGFATVDELQGCQEENEAPFADAYQIESSAAKANKETEFQIQYKSPTRGDARKLLDPEINKSTEELRQESLKVIPNPLEVMTLKVESKERQELVDVSTKAVTIGVANFRSISVENFENPTAHKVFVAMSWQIESSFDVAASLVEHRVQYENLVFDPGIAEICTGLSDFLKTHESIELEKGRAPQMLNFIHTVEFGKLDNVFCHHFESTDREDSSLMGRSCRFCTESSLLRIMNICWVSLGIWIFDPGGHELQIKLWLLVSLHVMVIWGLEFAGFHMSTRQYG